MRLIVSLKNNAWNSYVVDMGGVETLPETQLYKRF